VFKNTDTQGTLSKTLVNDYLLTWIKAFVTNRKAQGVKNLKSIQYNNCGPVQRTTQNMSQDRFGELNFRLY